MTSHPSVGIRRPPLPSSSSSFPRPPSHTASHASPQLPRPASQVVIDLTDALKSSRDLSGPAHKRQKLDDGTISGDLKSPLLGDGEPMLQTSQRSIVGSPVSVNINTSSLNSPRPQDPRYVEDRSRSSLPFPIRPGKYVPRPPKRLPYNKTTTRGDVQVKPYILSIPTFAPQYATDSKSSTATPQVLGLRMLKCVSSYLQDRQISSPGVEITRRIF